MSLSKLLLPLLPLLLLLLLLILVLVLLLLLLLDTEARGDPDGEVEGGGRRAMEGKRRDELGVAGLRRACVRRACVRACVRGWACVGCVGTFASEFPRVVHRACVPGLAWVGGPASPRHRRAMPRGRRTAQERNVPPYPPTYVRNVHVHTCAVTYVPTHVLYTRTHLCRDVCTHPRTYCARVLTHQATYCTRAPVPSRARRTLARSRAHSRGAARKETTASSSCPRRGASV